MTDSKTYEYMLCCHQEERFGTGYLVLSFARREVGTLLVLTCPGRGESEWEHSPKHLWGLQLDTLRKYAFVHSDKERRATWSDWHYEPHHVEACEARRMVKTLDKVYRGQQKEHAYEIGDQVIAIARLFRIKIFALRKGEEYERRTGSRWHVCDIVRGRDLVREQVEEFCRTARASWPD